MQTVAKYLDHLEEAFLFFSLPRFSFRVRELATANRKINCIDNGLVTARATQFSPDPGRLVENLARPRRADRVAVSRDLNRLLKTDEHIMIM